MHPLGGAAPDNSELPPAYYLLSLSLSFSLGVLTAVDAEGAAQIFAGLRAIGGDWRTL